MSIHSIENKHYPVVFLATFAMAIEAIIVELFYVVLAIPTLVVAMNNAYQK